MKVLAVRIAKGEVLVEGKAASSVGKGLALFVGIEKGDHASFLATMADKVLHLRIFEDEQGKLNFGLKDKNYQVLCVPNFTLCAKTDKGRRPSFEGSLERGEAKKYYDDFVRVLKSQEVDVQSGVFGAHMDIDLVLDGPVNILLEL